MDIGTFPAVYLLRATIGNNRAQEERAAARAKADAARAEAERKAAPMRKRSLPSGMRAKPAVASYGCQAQRVSHACLGRAP